MLGFPLGILSAAGAAVGEVGDYELISSTILGGTAASVTFSNLGDYSSTYKHLQLRVLDRQTGAVTEQLGSITFNAAAGTRSHLLFGNGTSVSSINQASSMAAYGIADLDTANVFTARVIDILDSFSTTKNKTLRMLHGNVASANKRIILASGFWNNTAAITSVTMTSASTYMTGSRFSLYGIKG
jgi:hypothetical protein